MSVLQAYLQGRQARQQQNQMDRQNAMQEYMGQNAQGIFAGDNQALGGLAQFDPMMALNLKGTINADKRGERAEGRAIRSEERAGAAFNQQLKEWADKASDEEKAEAAAEIRDTVQRALSGGMTQEQFDQWAATEAPQMQGMTIEQAAKSMLSIADQLKMGAAPEPKSPAGKVMSDLNAGIITPEIAEKELAGSGMRVTSDGEGGFTIEQGTGVTGTQIGSAGQNKLDKSEIDTRDTLARLERIDTNLLENPQLLDAQTIHGNLKRSGLEWKDFLGGDLTDEQAKYLVDVTEMRGDVLENLNYTIQAITGAAMSEPEAKRIGATLPNVNDSPTVFKAKLDRSLDATRMAVARYNYWRNNGLDGNPMDVATLSDMDRIMTERAAEILEEQLRNNPDPEQAKQAAKTIFAQEFGIE